MAARTNLSSHDVRFTNRRIGEGTFRVAIEGIYIGGNRNGQEAACKRFKPRFRDMADEYFALDLRIIDKAVSIAEDWNDMAEEDEKILFNKGYIRESNSGIQYLVEPLIRDYTKYTSNSGWIWNCDTWQVRAMEAFTHYSYDWSGGQYIVCDLQGRYRYSRFNQGKCRFELTDPAICSRNRRFGPTDLGEKGIESFFANHQCNGFCNIGRKWKRPRRCSQWFPATQGTSMLSSRMSHHLNLRSNAHFRLGLNDIMEVDSDSDSDDSW